MRPLRPGVLALVVALQFVQLAAAVPQTKALCCCRGNVCMMKMHCAKGDCALRERPASITAADAILPAPVVSGAPAVRPIEKLTFSSFILDGFARVDTRPPRSSRMVS